MEEKPKQDEVYTIFGNYLDLMNKDVRISGIEKANNTDQSKAMVAALLTLGNIILGG